jgi:hypothetical protein
VLGRARGGGGVVKDGVEQGAEGQAEAMGGKWGMWNCRRYQRGSTGKVGARV